MRLLLLAFLLFVTPFYTMAQLSTVQSKNITDLKYILMTADRWVKVHAAEFLLWEGFERDAVYEEFKVQEQLFDTVSQYRVGIWRVLYQATTDVQERNHYLEKIEKAYKEGPDQLHALETLAKLKQPIQDDEQFIAGVLDAKLIDAKNIYGLWNLFYNPNVDRLFVLDRLLHILKDPMQTANNKIIVAYVLRFLDLTPAIAHEMRMLPYKSWPQEVQLQYVATMICKLRDEPGQSLQADLIRFVNLPNYYPTAILAIASSVDQGNHSLLQNYYDLLTAAKSINYNADHHATAAYAMLKYLSR